METSKSTKRIRVAISGGGLAGATIANGLQKYPHLDVHIYESSSQFSERGAAVALNPNTLSALNEIGTGIMTAVEAAGAVPMHSTRQMIGSGKDAGTLLFDLVHPQEALIVHRAAFLQELLKPIPQSSMHVNKKLVKIEEAKDNGGGVLLHFADESVEHADVLIGADGIHGHVRKHILGEDHPATRAVFAGFWDCRALVSLEDAKKSLGEDYFKEDRQWCWLGDGGFMQHDVLNNGETVQCIAAVFAEDEVWGPDEWRRPLDRKKLEEAFESWKDGPIANGMIDLLLTNPGLVSFALNHHLHAPTYVKGRVCMMGDAAHAMTPFMGSGAGSAIEDAMVLQALLASIDDTSHLNAALQAYDFVRRPRTQRIVDSSKETGNISCGRHPEIGLDMEKLRANLSTKFGFIYGMDVKEHKQQAIQAMKELISST